MRRLIPSVPLAAVLLSILLHGAVLVPATGLLNTAVDQPTQTEQGSIEFLPVEIAGADPENPTEPAKEPIQDPDQARIAETPPQDNLAAITEPAQPDTTIETQVQPRQAAPPPRPDALAFQLSGTDSPSNALVTGPDVIPASPDDRGRNRPPVYPRDAARRGEQGTVVVVIRVSSMGLAEGADIMESSGYYALDQAVMDAVLTWRFRPAVQRGRAIPFDMPMRFIFAAR